MLWRVWMPLVLLLLGGCEDVAVSIGGPVGASRALFSSGLYSYRAWSDYSHRGPVWWGFVELRVEGGGRITGVYRLPRQCSDAYGLGADCVGRVGGRLYTDGMIRFGFDEGWLSHEGWVDRGSAITGRWESRVLGYQDRGTFELVPSWR